jgi:hypothetical protein
MLNYDREVLSHLFNNLKGAIFPREEALSLVDVKAGFLSVFKSLKSEALDDYNMNIGPWLVQIVEENLQVEANG